MKTVKIILLNLLLVSVLIGQDISFNAGVDRTTVGLGESFELRFIIKANNVNAVRGFKPPNFSNFFLLSGPNQSTSMQIINGAMSASITYSYVMQAKSPGSASIGAASVFYDNKEYFTKPITLNITRSSTQQKPTQTPQQSRQQQGGAPQVITKDLSQNIFLRAVVDKSKVYQGEQVNVTFKLYISGVGVSNYTVSKTPSLKGFWSEEFNLGQQVTLGTETVNGKMYKVGTIRKLALFPTQSGTLEIDPMDLDLILQVQNKKKRSGDIFDQFFGDDPFFNPYTNMQYTVKSPAVKVNVAPLPVTNIPSSYKGSVGKFDLESSISTSKPKTNEPVTLKLKISGEGNIKLIETPEVSLPSDIEKYEPKINDNLNKSQVISGSRTIEYLFIPRYPGEKVIPPIEFTYFDLGKKNFVTLKTPEYKLNVEQGNQTFASGNANRDDIKLLGQDISFIRLSKSAVSKKSDYFYTTPYYYLLYLVVLGIMFAALGYRKKVDKDLSDLAGFRMRRANKISVKRLSKAKKFMDASKYDDYYKELSLAVWGYLTDKLKIQQAELSIEKVISVLNNQQVSEEILSSTKRCLDLCEFARFSPNSETSVEAFKFYQEVKNTIILLENSLKNQI
jgi:hypothetical protein